MRFRITEPTFFLHRDREVGEIMEAPVGPYRNVATGGGLQRIPQFVEMPDEIKQVLQEAVAQAAPLPAQGLGQQGGLSGLGGAQASGAGGAGTFAQATASILKPVAPPPKPAGVSPAAALAALTTRRRKLTDNIGGEISAYGKRLDEIEAKVPQVFTKANTRLDDEQANLSDLDNSLNDFAGANGGDPL